MVFVCLSVEEPWSAEILSATRFNGPAEDMPPSFKKAAESFRNCVKAAKLSALSTAESLAAGINVKHFAVRQHREWKGVSGKNCR